MTFFEGSSAFLFPPPCLAATFTMTTHTTTTTTTLVAATSPIIKSSKPSSSSPPTPTTATTPPSPAQTSTVPPVSRTPPFFPKVYAGNKRHSVAVSEQPAKKLRQNGAFRPRICSFSGPRMGAFTQERRYELPLCCAVGKRRGEEGGEEKGLKARVGRNRRLHFITGEEEVEVEVKKDVVATPAIVEPRLPIYLRRDARQDKAVFHLDIRKSEPMQPTPEEPESDAETIVPSRVVKEELEKPKVAKRAVLTSVQPVSSPSPNKSVDHHDDCPADDDEPKKPKEKSVLSKIGSLRSFKDAVAKAGSKVKKWKQRKEKEQEEKKKAVEEKKNKKKEVKDKKQKEVHDSGSDTEEDEPKTAAKSKDKSLRNSLRLKSSKKSRTHVRNVFKSTHDDEGSDDEVEVKPKRRSVRAASPPPPSPKSPTDAEMKDSVNHADTESDGSGDETEEDKPKKKKKSVKEDKDDKEEEEEEKPKKKRLSLSSIETVEKPKEEKEKTPESSAASIKDIEMILDEEESENTETKSIKSSDSLEEMDLDDNKTIRGDDEKDNTGSSEDSESEPKKTSETADAPSKEPASKSDIDDADETATICGKSDDTEQKADASKSESEGSQEAKSSSDCKGDDDKTVDPKSSFSGLRRAVLAVLPPCDVLTPPPTPPLGCTSPKAGDRSHWISWRAGFSSTDGNGITEDDHAIWRETWTPAQSGKRSLVRRLSAIFKKTLEESDVPSNISRHAYRDSFCRDDDEDTECDANSVYKLPLTTSPPGIDFCAWGPADNGTVDSRFLERLESFTMAC